MLQEQLEAYGHNYREAFKSVIGNVETQYYRQGDLELAKTADTEPWIPSQDVQNYMPNLNIMRVEMIDENANFEQLLSKFAGQSIGLVLMGQNIIRRKRPTLIVITTYDALYVIDPDFREGMKFVDNCLKNERITVWTTNGLHEAGCLLEHFGIKLTDSQARDCLGVHLHLMKVLGCLADSRYQTLYPSKAIRQARRPLRLESFDKLIYIWLDIQDSDSVHCPPNQLAHLSQRPLNLTAINLIKKRCSLVLRLAECLMYHARLESYLINKNVLNSLVLLKEDLALKKMKRYICSNEEKKKLVKTYFAHLDGDSDVGDD